MLKKNPSQPEELKRMIGPLKIDLEKDGALDNLGQPNIIDYVDHEPFLTSLSDRGLGGGQPGTILPNNEPTSRSPYPVDGLRPGGEFDKMSGHGAVGADKSQPTLPTGAPTSIPKLLPTELQEAFVEGDHPREPEGSPEGGRFVSGEVQSITSFGFDEKRLEGKKQNELAQMMSHWTDQANIKDATTEELQDVENWKDKIRAKFQELDDAGEVSDIQREQFDKKYGLKIAGQEVPKTTGLGPPPTRDLYKDLPQDTDKAGEGRKKRKEVFEKYEEKNGELYEHRSTVQSQKRQIEYQEEQIEKREGEEEPEVTENRRKNIEALKEDIKKHTNKADEIETKLRKSGKLEYEEVQRLLDQRKDYDDDLKRRKTGSMAYYKAMGQVHAHDRAIDEYRTGNKPGHFAGAEMEEFKVKEQKAHEDTRKVIQAEKEKKDVKKYTKFREEIKDAKARLKDSEIEVDAKGMPIGEDYKEKITPPAIRPSTMEGHKNWLKEYKTAIQNNSDLMTIRRNEHELRGDYSSDYYKRQQVQANWKADNFVDDHSMIGIAVYNDGDPGQVAIYEKKFQEAPKIGRDAVKKIEIFKGKGPTFARGRNVRGGVTLGSWDREGGIKLFFASKKQRDKLISMGSTKDDFDLTGDHEFAHATWTGVQQKINASKVTPDGSGGYTAGGDLSSKFEDFKRVVRSAYSNKDFKVHPYTDSYKHARGMGFGNDDILENETHSKLREFEVAGDLDGMHDKALLVRQQSDDYDSKPNAKKRVDEKYGSMDDYAKSQGYSSQAHGKLMASVIDRYKDFRKEMLSIA